MVWGVISGFLLSQVFGALWYSPMLAGNFWAKSAFPGQTCKQIGQGFASTYIFTLVSHATLSLLMQFILVNFLKVATLAVAVKASLGLAALMTLTDISHLVFSKRPVVAFLLDHTFDAIVLAINGACIFYFS